MKPISAFNAPALITGVKFSCFVNHQLLEAEIVEELADPINFAFRINFSNGTEVVAVSSERYGWVANNPKHASYVKAIKIPLQDFFSVKRGEWEKFFVTYKGEVILVWVSKITSDDYGPHFDVHFNGNLRFSLKQNADNWEAFCKSVVNPALPEEGLAMLITAQMEKVFA